MELVNKTQFAAGWTMGFARDGREIVVVVIKGTFVVPQDGGDPQPVDEQVPLVEADQFTAAPGLSAPLYESDYAHHKPMCDVLVNGTAYAPSGRRALQLTVGVRVGPMVKSFGVVGDRVWSRGLTGIKPSDPAPFEAMPISYNCAFGGVDDGTGEKSGSKTFIENPVGRGYRPSREDLDGKPLPNTEEIQSPVTDPSGRYKPMALGPVGRNWRPRAGYAGTYDQRWLEDQMPFWPDDFDYRYFQAAPEDQQIPFPTGGEPVVLKNLTPEGFQSFHLPAIPMPVWFLPYRGKDTKVDARLDGILIEPDRHRLLLTWRAALPMRRNCFDVRRVIAGQMPEAWQRARRFGNKPYYQGLDELVRARRGGR